MQNLDLVAEELFNKIRGRFPSVTIGDAEGNVTNEPKLGRYFDFNFMSEGRPVGKVSVSLDNKVVAVVYGEDLVATEGNLIKNNWYDFLKELRMFAKKRTLAFDTRDITKSNLSSRDYKFLAKNRDGEESMKESKLYGTSRISYQNFDGARLMIKHTEGINQELAGGRAKKVGSLYIESAEGERFKYPYKHLTGARAMARHVAEGGNAYDDFGKHIVSMSEEMSKLRKFKTYMGRSAVMAESLAGYMDVVRERIATVKKTLESLQRPSYYKETFEAFAPAVMEDVPSDVAENWIDQLTIKQFNEELSDVFPYIYNLVSEATKATELGPLDLQGYTVHEVAGPKDCWDGYKKDGTQKGTGKNKGKRVNKCVPEDLELEAGFEEMMGQFAEGETNEEVEVSDEMRDQISDWIEKYSKYKGGNDDTLPEGYIEWALNSGIATDFIEQNEIDAMEKKYGDAFDEDPWRLDFYNEMPITKACMEELEKITGDTDIDANARIIDAVMHGDGNESTFDESFDPQSEPSQRDLAVEEMMDAYEKGGEKAVADYMHISEEELDQDINEWCAEHGKHPDDDRDEAIQGVIEELADMTEFDEASDIEFETDVQEASINSSKDASDALGVLRGKGKKIETGDGEYEGNLANEYASEVWDVYTWIESNTNGFQGIDPKFQAAIDDMMTLRGEAKKLETKPGSGKNGKFGNQIVNTLYPVMQYIDATDFDKKEDDDTMDVKINDKGQLSKDDGTEEKEQKTPLGEFILSYFDRDNGTFPKGETAVLTMIEKDYGEKFIDPAKKFIEQIQAKFDEHQMHTEPQQMEEPKTSEYDRIRELAGLR